MSKQQTASKAILQYLTGHGRVRTEKLRRAICDPPPEGKNICTPKMFYRYLADLVESKRVTKFEESRNVVYYAKPKWAEYENSIVQSAVDRSRDIVIKLERITPITSDSREVPGLEPDETLTILSLYGDILHDAFIGIMDLFSWATLAKLRNPKENSIAIDGILNGTFPDLMKLFSEKIETIEKYRPEIIEDLLDLQSKVPKLIADAKKINRDIL